MTEQHDLDGAEVQIVSDGTWWGSYVKVDGKHLDCTDVELNIAVGRTITARLTIENVKADVTFVNQIVAARVFDIPDRVATDAAVEASRVEATAPHA